MLLKKTYVGIGFVLGIKSCMTTVPIHVHTGEKTISKSKKVQWIYFITCDTELGHAEEKKKEKKKGPTKPGSAASVANHRTKQMKYSSLSI